MTVFAMMLALTAAMGAGYLVGQRAGSRRPTWRQRTRRTALGRQAVGLAFLVAAGEMQRSVRRRMQGTSSQRSLTSTLPGRRLRSHASTHKMPAVKRWLTTHPWFELHFTPTSSSWRNLVERGFAASIGKLLHPN